MAYRCRNCGMVFEGDNKMERAFSCGKCPNDRNHAHFWMHFESAQDKQNKLLEQQNQILMAQNANQDSSPSTQSKSSGTRLGTGDLDHADRIGETLGFKKRNGEVGRCVFNILLWFSANPVFWLLVRDGGFKKIEWIDVSKTGLPSNNAIVYEKPFECSGSGKAWKEMGAFYKPAIQKAIERIKGRGLDLERIYVDCFKESELNKQLLAFDGLKGWENVSKMQEKIKNDLFSVMPNDFLDVLDEEVKKQDGKEKLKMLLSNTKAEKGANNTTLIAGFSIVAVILILIIRCAVS